MCTKQRGNPFADLWAFGVTHYLDCGLIYGSIFAGGAVDFDSWDLGQVVGFGSAGRVRSFTRARLTL